MRLIRGKRGEEEVDSSSQTTVYAILWIIGVAFTFAGLLGYAQTFKAMNYSIPETLKTEVLAYRFVSSGSCLAYTYLGRTYAGVVDYSKFNDQRALDKCYYVPKDAGLTAYSLKLELDSTGESKTLATSNWDPEKPASRTMKKPVAVRTGKLETGFLYISVQKNQ